MADSSRTTFLLTGATGLLGRYILARLLHMGKSVAVLVRSTPMAAASQRIEQCLQLFETQNLLPRPHILEGDLRKPGLGLDAAATQRLAGHRLRVIHCAASIRFVASRDTDEPYATNVGGTTHLLEFCRGMQVLDFHHVSTAYVGARQGQERVPEAWVLSPQSAGNDYERSKIIAEQLVRECDALPSRTVHRPSIIVGDSQTGFTSTFHGFYAPLQIGAQYAQRFGLDAPAADRFRQHLGLGTGDTKNLVPVDWVAAAIVATATQPPNPGDRILHWTHPRPVPCAEMQAAILDALQQHFGEENNALPKNDTMRITIRDRGGSAGETIDRDAQDFRQQMDVYESYFGADPEFSRDNALRALGSAEPPVAEVPRVDQRLLTDLANFALSSQFGWPRPALPSLPSGELEDCLRILQVDAAAGPVPRGQPCEMSFRLRTLGPWGPGDIEYGWGGDRWHAWPVNCLPSFEWWIPIERLQGCIIDTVSVRELIDTGYCVILGSQREDCLEMINRWVKDVSSRISAR